MPLNSERGTPEGRNHLSEMTGREHALIVRLKLSDDSFGNLEEREAAFGIEDSLVDALKGEVAVVDGHEFGGGFATIFLYGADVNTVSARALPVLKSKANRPGSYVVKRYGPPGADETREFI